MKKRFLGALALFTAVVVLSLVTVSAAPTSVSVQKACEPPVNKALNVAGSEVYVPEASKVLEARFLNMLNHSFVYGEDFDTVEAIVNNSVIALLDLRDSADDSYIAESIVADYVFDMYGVEITDFSGINPMFEQKEGYVFILPRGYSVYSHKMVEYFENEDGSFTVKTEVTVSSHDGVQYTEPCTSLIVINEDSAFGFSIVASEIGTKASEI